MVTYNNITGKPIDDVPGIGDGSYLNGTDLFVASQQVLSNVSPTRTYDSHGNHYENEYRSIKVSYEQLSNQIFNDLCSLYGLGNMAWESSAEYSLANHIHNYSKTEQFLNMSPSAVGKYNIDTRIYDEAVNIATIAIDSKYQTYAMPLIHPYEQPKAYIGQLKFIAIPSFKDVDEYSANFDGWTYPDGRMFLSSDFIDAWNVFGDSYGVDNSTQKFAIPNLNGFFKPRQFDIDNVDESLIEQRPGHSYLPSHTHNVDNVKLSGRVNISMKLPITNSGSSAKGLHNSSGNINHPSCYCIIDISDFKSASGYTTNSDTELDIQTHPTYDTMPVMIYIGKNANA